MACIALLARLVHLDHPPFIDELNHVLAARALLADGTLLIPGGDDPYTRARGFTYLVAALFRLFGESLVVARMPSVLAGSALVALIFWWVRRHAGGLAAWVAALLLAFYPHSLFLSQIVRFYTIHALLYWAAAILVFEAVRRGTPQRRAREYGIGAIVCLALGAHLQVLTAVGAAGLVAWALSMTIGSWRSWYGAAPRNRRLLHAALVLGLAAAFAWIVSGGAAAAWQLFQHADLWAEDNRYNPLYYHNILLHNYGTVWGVFPFVALFAVYLQPRLALLCLMVFATGFGFHSVAAWKAERYIYYIMPGFFVVTGIAAAGVMASFERRSQQIAAELAGGRVPPAAVTTLLVVLLLVSVRASFGVNHAFRAAGAILTAPRSERPLPYTRADWASIEPHVRPLIEAGAVVVATANLNSIHYLQRLDYDLSALHLNDWGGPYPEFTVHRKTGRPAISQASSLEQVHRCHERGIVLIETRHWTDPTVLPAATATYIAHNLAPFPLPPGAHILGFWWVADARAPVEACPAGG